MGTAGAATAAKLPPAGAPGAAAAFVVLFEVKGVGVENEDAEFSVTDCPLATTFVPLLHVWPFPPVNSPILPSTRKRTAGGEPGTF